MSTEASVLSVPAHGTATLLGLTLEIRVEIYKLLNIKPDPLAQMSPEQRASHIAYKQWKEKEKAKCVLHRGDLDRYPPVIEPDHLLPLLLTCRKTYLEAQSLWLEHITVRIMESSFAFDNTFTIFEKYGNERLQLLRKVAIVIKPDGRGEWHSPIPCLKLVESFPDTTEVEVFVENYKICEIWCPAYGLAKKTRQAGMSWNDVEYCVGQLHSVLRACDFYDVGY